MASAAEALGDQSQMKAALAAGLQTLGSDETVTFTNYAKFTHPIDGSVFWIATPQTMVASGVVHHIADRQQDEDETIAANQILFSSEQPVAGLNEIAPDTMWIGDWPVGENQTLKIAFARRGPLFEEAKVWHYAGFAVYPALFTQLITDPTTILAGPIVNNSLPIWLSLTGYGGEGATVPVYPSYLVPDNIAPPYVVAHIRPGSTVALASAPLEQWPAIQQPPPPGAPADWAPFYTIAASQQMQEDVDLTLYGFTAQTAFQYLYALIQASMIPIDTGPPEQFPFGFASTPAIQDEKRVQVEIRTIAQKKRISFRANYYQGAADVVARRLIVKALPPAITIGAV